MEHGAVPLEDAHAGLEQRPVAGAGHHAEGGDVGGAGHEEPDVDAVPRGDAQRLHVGRGAGVVGVGEPQRAAGQAGHELVDAEESRGVGHGGDDAQGDTVDRVVAGVAMARDVGLRDGMLLVGERVPGRGPGVGEGILDVGHGGAAHLDPGVPPGIAAAVGLAHPHTTHAQAGHEPDLVVDGDHLAVVAAHEAQGALEARRVVAAHLDASRAQPVPEPAGGLAEAAHPVVEQPHAHALARLGDEGVREEPPLLVLVDDVHLEVDGAARGGDGVQPPRVVLGGVLEEADAVALAQPRPRGAREDLVRDLAQAQERGDSVGAAHLRDGGAHGAIGIATAAKQCLKACNLS